MPLGLSSVYAPALNALKCYLMRCHAMDRRFIPLHSASSIRTMDAVHLHVYRLHLRPRFDARQPILRAQTGMLVPAPRQFHRRQVVVVDVRRASLQLSHNTMRASDVVGEDACRQAVRRVVGTLDDFCFRLEGQNGHDHAEDLVLHDLHVVTTIGENGRFQEPAGTWEACAAVQQCRAVLVASNVDVMLDLLHVLLRDHGANLGRLVHGISDSKFLCALHETIQELRHDGVLDEDTRRIAANLTTGVPVPDHGRRDGIVEVIARVGAIFKHDQW
mmetsp:Transcript_9263/g.25038  ORF Transcript_9263/g.25038 Transcript_9263/m.25038 type:complete len:274 (-) Transcript_9263:29-850(-)